MAALSADYWAGVRMGLQVAATAIRHELENPAIPETSQHDVRVVLEGLAAAFVSDRVSEEIASAAADTDGPPPMLVDNSIIGLSEHA